MVSSQVRLANTPIRQTGEDTIKVLGVGRTGIRILHRLLTQRVRDAEYHALFTDRFHCEALYGPNMQQIGRETTGGIGAFGDPSIGLMAAEESREEIQQIVEGGELVIVTAGLGAGTGSGAAPYISSLAKQSGASVMAAVTMPYGFEATQRRANAEEALAELKGTADTIIAVSLEKTMQYGDFNENEALERAYSMLDEGIQTVMQAASCADSINRFGMMNAMLNLAALH